MIRGEDFKMASDGACATRARETIENRHQVKRSICTRRDKKDEERLAASTAARHCFGAVSDGGRPLSQSRCLGVCRPQHSGPHTPYQRHRRIWRTHTSVFLAFHLRENHSRFGLWLRYRSNLFGALTTLIVRGAAQAIRNTGTMDPG